MWILIKHAKSNCQTTIYFNFRKIKNVQKKIVGTKIKLFLFYKEKNILVNI